MQELAINSYRTQEKQQLAYHMQRFIFICGCLYILAFGFISGFMLANNDLCSTVNVFSCQCFYINVPYGAYTIFTTGISYLCSRSDWVFVFGLEYQHLYSILSRLYYIIIIFNMLTAAFVVDTFDRLVKRLVANANYLIENHCVTWNFLIWLSMWPLLIILCIINYIAGKSFSKDCFFPWLKQKSPSHQNHNLNKKVVNKNYVASANQECDHVQRGQMTFSQYKQIDNGNKTLVAQTNKMNLFDVEDGEEMNSLLNQQEHQTDHQQNHFVIDDQYQRHQDQDQEIFASHSESSSTTEEETKNDKYRPINRKRKMSVVIDIEKLDQSSDYNQSVQHMNLSASKLDENYGNNPTKRLQLMAEFKRKTS